MYRTLEHLTSVASWDWALFPSPPHAAPFGFSPGFGRSHLLLKESCGWCWGAQVFLPQLFSFLFSLLSAPTQSPFFLSLCQFPWLIPAFRIIPGLTQAQMGAAATLHATHPTMSSSPLPFPFFFGPPFLTSWNGIHMHTVEQLTLWKPVTQVCPFFVVPSVTASFSRGWL